QYGVNQLLELGAREFHHKMLRPRLVSSDEGQVNLRLHSGGEFNLRLLGSLFQTLQGHLVVRKINALIALELFYDPLNKAFVYVVAAKVSVAVGGFHLDHALADFQNGDVERSAAEVKHC